MDGQNFAYDIAGRMVNYNGLAYAPDAQHTHAVNLVNGMDRAFSCCIPSDEKQCFLR